MIIHRIGVLSDTHGLLRPEVLDAFQGVELILHAGDVGKPEVLAGLQSVAPVVAVRGNVDYGEWANALRETQATEVGGAWIYMLHDLSRLDIDPAGGGFRVVISGHSHRPLITCKADVLYLNPGAAGPRRFSLPVAVALLEVAGDRVEARLVQLGGR